MEEVFVKGNSEIELQMFQKAFDTSPDDILIIDRFSMKFIEVNHAACISTEYSRDELLKMGLSDLSVHFLDDKIAMKFDEISKTKNSFAVLQTSFQSKSGIEKEVEIFMRVFIQHEKSFIIASARDITERKLMEDLTKNLNRELEKRVQYKTIELEDANFLLNNVMERVTEGFIAFDKNLNFVYLNRAALTILEKNAYELIGKNIFDVFPDISNKLQSYFKKAMNEQVCISYEEYYAPWKRWFYCRLFPAQDGITLLFREITEQKLAEEHLHEYSEQLQQLNARLQHVREEERTSIAREIHDELGQQLTGLKMDIAWLNKKLEPGNSLLLEKSKEMISLIDKLIHSVKRISSDLRPGVLDDLGLEAALEWRASDFEKHTGIRCEFHSLLTEKKFSRDFSTAVFRIFQETLTNVVRHSQATEVKAVADEDDHNLKLTIVDNGIGISENEINNFSSLGLLGMSERARLLGGRISVEGMKGKGTTVTLEIPIK